MQVKINESDDESESSQDDGSEKSHKVYHLVRSNYIPHRNGAAILARIHRKIFI